MSLQQKILGTDRNLRLANDKAHHLTSSLIPQLSALKPPSPPTPKTLQVILPKGTPSGIQIAELTN